MPDYGRIQRICVTLVMMATLIRHIGLYRQPVTVQLQLALKHARYDANWFKAEFKQSGEEEHQVTQPNTLSRQQALANACNHGGQFHASGGGTHLKCNDIFIAAEIPSRQKDRDEAEWEKKHHLQLKAAEEKVLAIVEQGKSINKLTLADLNVLLDWHQVKMPQKSKKEDKLGGWM